MKWYSALPKRWQAEQAVAKRLLENVEVGFDPHGRAFIGGSLRLVSEHGHEWGVFRIRIIYPEDFLKHRHCPSVYLDSHHDKWKKGPDAHIEDDWKLCLFVPIESGIDFLQEDSLDRLLETIRTFLAKERIYQRDLAKQPITGQRAIWPGTARPHGEQGMIEAIQDAGSIGRKAPCPCGSGKKYKHCCLRRIERKVGHG